MLNQKVAGFLLKSLGWKAGEPTAPEKKCIILGVPHTSVWDLVISYLDYRSVGGDARVMDKKEFFFWPLGPIIRWMGGIPVDRSRKGGATLVRQMVERFEKEETFHLAIAPEGTRKAVTKWKAGFHTIARAANVPVYMGYYDWRRKIVGRGQKVELTDDAKADLARIQKLYHDLDLGAKYPKDYKTGY